MRDRFTVSLQTLHQRCRTLMILTATTAAIPKPVIVTPIKLPPAVASHINLLLSFTSGNRLLFISRDFSVCSWHFQSSATVAPSPSTLQQKGSTGPKPFKELFYLPGDWIGTESISLTAIWKKERSFLCPKSGDVALVKCTSLD